MKWTDAFLWQREVQAKPPCHLEITGRKVLVCFVGNHKEIKEKNAQDFRKQVQFSLICFFPTFH